MRVYPSERIAFLITYRVRDTADQRFETLGRYGQITLDQARRLAQERFFAVASGRDPQGEKHHSRRAAATAPTVRDLFLRYMEEHAKPHKRSAAEDERLWQATVLPRLGEHRKVKELERDDLVAVHLGIGGPPPTGQGKRVLANRVLALLSTALRLAEEWGWRPHGSNPCRAVKKFAEAKRGKRLKAEEMGTLWRALDDAEAERSLSGESIAYYRLLLLTGARPGEVAGLEWSWVDLDAGTVRLPIAKADRGSSVEGRTIFLPRLAIEILDILRQSAEPGQDMVLPGSRRGQRRTGFHKAWEHLCRRAGLVGYRPDDLRHTYISSGTAAGVPVELMQGLAGHRKIETTVGTYRHADDAEQKQAAQAMDGYFRQIFHPVP